ncbi:MAG TPA: LCP family protein [Gaiellaceae bacterium]|jgi:LCP family protein required for cell wall assembly
MAPEEKPYRVYRGGRAKGQVPSAAGRPARSSGFRFSLRKKKTTASTGGRDYRGPGARRRGGRRWVRWVGIGVAVLFVLFVVWGITSWLSFSSGVSDANKRLDPNAKAALSKQGGLLLSHSTTVLLLGTDNADVSGREGDRHSDSMMLMRSDPSHHRMYYLSIPRDLVVPIPGAATQKINAAFQIGGPALAIKTVQQFTGLPINHVVVVNFAAFKDLIDALGGITVNVPEQIVSNRFDCPYASQAACDKWPGWRFHKGSQHMNGQRALIYSRIRENSKNPADNDITRGGRQQAVMDATLSKLTSFGELASMPFDGGKVAKPLTTDMSAWQLVQFGWARFRSSAGSSVHCRLGGDLGGGGTGSPSEDDPATIAMFLGKSAPQPPTDAFGPGCVVGHTLN